MVYLGIVVIIVGVSYSFIQIVTIINPYTERLLRMIFEK